MESYIDQCMLKKKLSNLVCDFGGCTYPEGTVQCPTRIFNKCQNEEIFNLEDLCFINSFIINNIN